MDINGAEQEKEKRMKGNEDSLRDFSNNIKLNNIHIIWVPEGGEINELRTYLKAQ